MVYGIPANLTGLEGIMVYANDVTTGLYGTLGAFAFFSIVFLVLLSKSSFTVAFMGGTFTAMMFSIIARVICTANGVCVVGDKTVILWVALAAIALAIVVKSGNG